MPVQITPSTAYIGVADTDLARFENQYPLTDGVTYNSYVISDSGVTAIIDAVDRRCESQWLQKVATAVPGRLDYLVVQHMEPDHSATIVALLTRHPEAKVVCSAAAIRMLGQFFPNTDFDGRTIAVTDGSVLEVGLHKLTFITAPMVHWPEVIMTYDTADGTLFSADAFGTFGTSGDPDALWPSEARRYYTNIVGKYGPQVQRALAKTAAFSDMERICPLHGPIISRSRIEACMSLYNRWSAYDPELPEGVLVAYASIYGNTRAAALHLAAGMESSGVTVTTIDLCSSDMSEAVSQAFRMGRIVLAAPSYDAGVFPAMHDFLYHLQIKGLHSRRFGLIQNGSWAPTAAKVMTDMIGQLKHCTIVEPVVTVKSAMSDSTPAELEALAAAICG